MTPGSPPQNAPTSESHARAPRSSSRRAPSSALRTPGRVDAALLLGAVTLFAVGYAIALSAPALSYTWQHDMVSDLGRATCREWQGDWVCSPRAHWFDACIAGAGACLLVAAARLARPWGAPLTVAASSLGVGLVWLAAVPSDSPLPLHMVGAVLALPVPSAALFASGRVGLTAWAATLRRTRLALGLVSLTLCLDHLAPPPAPIPRGGAETLSVAALLTFLTIEAGRCAHAARTSR